MVDVPETAPNFTAPRVDAEGNIEPFTLHDHLDEAPIVLAFFPGAFTSDCTEEMRSFQDRLDDIEEAGGTVYGVSVDTPFSLRRFQEEYDLEFGFVSDHRKRIVDKYDVRTDFTDIGYYGLAKRAVFVVNAAGSVTYEWDTDDPALRPTYREVIDAVRETA